MAFDMLPYGKPVPIVHWFVQYHMVFDIKIEDFRQKVRLVAWGLMSWETVKIALMIVALNDLEVKLGNILNAYVQAAVTEEVWTILGPEMW